MKAPSIILSRVAAAVVVIGLGAAALLPMGSEPANASSGPRAPEAIYTATCGYCHGFNVGPVIRGRNLPPQAIATFVREGRGAMPAFRPTEITDVELTALANWISASKADPKEHGQ